MNFIILGDKFQKRMKSRGCVGLIKTQSKTILQHQYKGIRKYFPDAKIIYVYGFEAKKFNSFLNKNDSIKQDIIPINNTQFDSYNNTHSLHIAQEFLTTDCCILFGDNVFDYSIWKKFRSTSCSQVFITRKNKNKLGCIINSNKKIENISYDLDNYLYDMYYVSKPQIDFIRSLVNNKIYHNYFIFELFNLLIDNNYPVVPFTIDSKKYHYEEQ